MSLVLYEGDPCGISPPGTPSQRSQGPLSGQLMPLGVLDVEETSRVASSMPHLFSLLYLLVLPVTYRDEIGYSVASSAFCGHGALGKRVSIARSV